MNYKKTLENVKKALENEKNKTIKNRLTVINVALQQIIKEVDNIENDVMTTDKAMDLIKETPLIDINGSAHEVEFFSVCLSEISFSLCDPGNWVSNEGRYEDILTRESFEFIEAQIKKRIPGAKVDQGQTHIADVEFIVEIPYRYKG